MANNLTQSFLGERSSWQSAEIELVDIQGLWGGFKITIRGSGSAAVQIVGRDGQIKNYLLRRTTAEFERLLQVLIDQDFLTIRPAERPGIPDESRPAITLVNAAGQRYTVSKWAGVKEPRFAAIYMALYEIVEAARSLGLGQE